MRTARKRGEEEGEEEEGQEERTVLAAVDEREPRVRQVEAAPLVDLRYVGRVRDACKR